MSTVVSEKTGKCCLSGKCFKNSDISACCFTSVLRARPPESRKYEFSARSHTFAMEKKLVPRESGGSGARREGKGGEEGASQSIGNFNHPCSAVWVHPGIHQVIGSEVMPDRRSTNFVKSTVFFYLARLLLLFQFLHTINVTTLYFSVF